MADLTILFEVYIVFDVTMLNLTDWMKKSPTCVDNSVLYGNSMYSHGGHQHMGKRKVTMCSYMGQHIPAYMYII